MNTDDPKFESRKKDHITQSLNSANQVGLSPSDQIKLFHKALPDVNFEEVSLKQTILNGIEVSSPIFVSSMTAGHQEGEKLNYTLAKACEAKNWVFAVGSQRKQLVDQMKDQEWSVLRQEFPNLKLVGNLGITQLISSGSDVVLRLIESLDAKAIFIHTNPLQEALQLEGTPQFKNSLKALEEVCSSSPVPVILKETGCGMDKDTLLKLFNIKNLYAVDVAGFGGTHWGRIEGGRNVSSLQNQSQGQAAGFDALKKTEMFIKASETYAQWGISTAQSLAYAQEAKEELQLKTKQLSTLKVESQVKVWASGGVRTGLDVVTCLSMGAEMVGLAQPLLKHALQGYDSLTQFMELLEFETKIGLFCTGYKDVSACQKDAKWEWK